MFGGSAQPLKVSELPYKETIANRHLVSSIKPPSTPSILQDTVRLYVSVWLGIYPSVSSYITNLYNVTMTKATSKSDKNLLKESGTAVAGAGVAAADALTSPFTGLPGGLTLAFNLSKGLYGNAMKLRQERVLEWAQSIMDNPAVFNETIVNSEEFQDGFVVALENYIKIRNHLNRRVALKIFKDFAASENKAEFQLERYNDTLQKISPQSIALLGFLKEVIIPYREKYIKEKMKGYNLGKEKSYDWWLKLYVSREPLASALSLWITEHYSPNGQVMKDKHGVGADKQIPNDKLSELHDIESKQRAKYYAPIGELEYLGLITKFVTGGGYDSLPSTTWTLSGFANEFIEFIENSPETVKLIGEADHEQ